MDVGARASEPPTSRRHTLPRKRPSFHSSTAISASASASTPKNAHGCAKASHSAAGTVASPSSDRPMFENGSGDVLTAARVVAFAKWLVAASVPPSSAATLAVSP